MHAAQRTLRQVRINASRTLLFFNSAQLICNKWKLINGDDQITAANIEKPEPRPLPIYIWADTAQAPFLPFLRLSDSAFHSFKLHFGIVIRMVINKSGATKLRLSKSGATKLRLSIFSLSAVT